MDGSFWGCLVVFVLVFSHKKVFVSFLYPSVFKRKKLFKNESRTYPFVNFHFLSSWLVFQRLTPYRLLLWWFWETLQLLCWLRMFLWSLHGIGYPFLPVKYISGLWMWWWIIWYSYQVKFLHGTVGFLGVLFNFCWFVGYEGDVVLAVLWMEF